jgi:DNA-binding XRE family transcriptional regulator
MTTGLTDAISQGLGRYSIGEKLRSLRLRKGMGLVELGQNAELSAALLSKLERGKLFPTLPTLLRIATVFGVGLDSFFSDTNRNAGPLGWCGGPSGCACPTGRSQRMCSAVLL